MRALVELNVNGHRHRIQVEPTRTLLDVLRNHLGLKGTRFGCGLEQCGACTVLVDGEPVLACGREVGTVADQEIKTIEGLSGANSFHPLQKAFLDHQAGQCGYCLSGILMRAAALLAKESHPSRDRIATALDDHLCRCGAHHRILSAIESAATAMADAP